MKLTLKTNVIPSVFTWSKEPSSCAKRRTARATLRMPVDEEEPISFMCDPDLDVQEVVIDDSQSAVEEDATVEFSVPVDNSSQTPPLPRVSIEDLTDDPKMLQYFTGLDSYRHFQYVMQGLGLAAYHLEYRKSVTAHNHQTAATQAKPRTLRGIRVQSVSNIFVNWINFMYCSWKELDI